MPSSIESARYHMDNSKKSDNMCFFEEEAHPSIKFGIDNLKIECPHCGWIGLGGETVDVGVNKLAVYDARCPQCRCLQSLGAVYWNDATQKYVFKRAYKHQEKKVLYIDMDNVLVDFASGIAQLNEDTKETYRGKYDEVPGIFALMKPMEGAIEAVYKLAKKYDLYVLSTAPWLNPSAWIDKVEWIQKYFGKDEESPLYKRLIISHHKNLNRGDFLIDDRIANGVEQFQGKHIHFGTTEYPNWDSVIAVLLSE